MQKGREHDRERERRRRKNRKYGQAKRKHSKRGILSCVLAGIVFVMLVSMLAKAYVSRGGAAPLVGALGFISVILSCCGLYMGLRGFKEREKDYLTCKIGSICSGLFVFGFILIFCRGLF